MYITLILRILSMKVRAEVEAKEGSLKKKSRGKAVETTEVRVRARWGATIQSALKRGRATQLSATERQQMVGNGGELLKDELVSVHQIDEGVFEMVREKMAGWKEVQKNSDLRKNPVTVEDLIAAWVYTMGPGGKAPNFCMCGWLGADGKTRPGETCSCAASPANFRIYDKFNRSMRDIEAKGSCEAEYEWFHYHLNNAVAHIPGAKSGQKLYRGAGSLFGELYAKGDVVTWKDYKSTSTKLVAAQKFAL